MKTEHFWRHCRITVKTWLFRFGEWLKDDGFPTKNDKASGGKKNGNKKK